MASLDNGEVRLEERLKVAKKVDVLVCGGGAAGVGAAIAAARKGKNTLLVEEQGCLGGLVTLGLVDMLAGFREGISREFIERLREEDALGEHNICDPEKTKRVLDQMVIEAGVHVLYWTHVIDAVIGDNAIRGVVIQSKPGRQAILAGVVIDCTGDAAVCPYAGVPFEVGRDEDGYNQAVSMDFVLGNVDSAAFKSRAFYSDITYQKMKEAAQKGELPELVERGYLGALPLRAANNFGEVYVCTAHSRRCHTTDGEDLTRIAVEQRKQIQQLVEFYRKHVVGFENCWLSSTAPILGVRDSRRIVGEYVLTGEDLVLARKFPDAIARDTHGFDIHNPSSQYPHIKHTLLDEAKEPAVCIKDESGKYRAYLKPGEYYEIPYRCLVPQKVDNMLVAGRCISADFEAQFGTRLILTCVNMGQAAGTAAAQAIDHQQSPREIDTDVLRDTLAEDGINLKEPAPPYIKGSPVTPDLSIPEGAEFYVSDLDADELLWKAPETD